MLRQVFFNCLGDFILIHVTIYPQVADILPSKTIPAVGRGASGKRTRSKPAPSFDNVLPISRTESLDSNKDTRDIASKPIVRFLKFLFFIF
jgi:hypothetical protein